MQRVQELPRQWGVSSSSWCHTWAQHRAAAAHPSHKQAQSSQHVSPKIQSKINCIIQSHLVHFAWVCITQALLTPCPTCDGCCVAVVQHQPSQVLIVYSCLIALAIQRASLMLKLKHFLSSFEGNALVTFWGLRTGSSAIYSVQLSEKHT